MHTSGLNVHNYSKHKVENKKDDFNELKLDIKSID